MHPKDEQTPHPSEIAQARSEEERLTERLRSLASAEHEATEAARWAQACKEFDSERGLKPDDLDDIAVEKHGHLELLDPELNARFCHEWVADCWTKSAPAVVQSFGTDAVRSFAPPHDLRPIVKAAFVRTQALYTDLLSTDLSPTHQQRIARELAELRVQLGKDRKTVCAFFQILESSAREQQAKCAEAKRLERDRLQGKPPPIESPNIDKASASQTQLDPHARARFVGLLNLAVRFASPNEFASALSSALLSLAELRLPPRLPSDSPDRIFANELILIFHDPRPTFDRVAAITSRVHQHALDIVSAATATPRHVHPVEAAVKWHEQHDHIVAAFVDGFFGPRRFETAWRTGTCSLSYLRWGIWRDLASLSGMEEEDGAFQDLDAPPSAADSGVSVRQLAIDLDRELRSLIDTAAGDARLRIRIRARCNLRRIVAGGLSSRALQALATAGATAVLADVVAALEDLTRLTRVGEMVQVSSGATPAIEFVVETKTVIVRIGNQSRSFRRSAGVDLLLLLLQKPHLKHTAIALRGMQPAKGRTRNRDYVRTTGVSEGVLSDVTGREYIDPSVLRQAKQLLRDVENVGAAGLTDDARATLTKLNDFLAEHDLRIGPNQKILPNIDSRLRKEQNLVGRQLREAKEEICEALPQLAVHMSFVVLSESGNMYAPSPGVESVVVRYAEGPRRPRRA